MDALYGNLENYQDENVISELRNENQALKCKLEEYASTLARLQKDFDNLSAEYKKLESNYSSLLKTARAEIERKSLLITNLNLEKDKLVIESIQNRGWINKRKINNGSNQHAANQSGKEAESAKQQQESAATNGTPKNVRETLSSHINNEKKDKQDNKHSLDPHSKCDIDTKENDHKSKTSHHNKDRDRNKNKNKSKEDHADVYTKTSLASKVLKINNRRKSMPLPNREDYTDEDQNDDHRDHRFRRTSPLRDTSDRKNHRSNHNGRHYPERKVAETTRVGDRHGSNYDSSREVCRKSSNWRQHSDKHRSRDHRDKYEPGRTRRHYSPDRHNNTQQYNMPDEYHNKHREPHDAISWSDNNRYRGLESPPPSDKYTSQRRSRDSDKTRFDRNPNQEVYPMKHKIHNAPEEPLTKRPRSESFNKQPDKHVNFQPDNDICSHTTATSKPLEFSYLSLQSPDHVHFDNPSLHNIKEIMSTANTELDDPRLTSKKYVVGTHKDKVVLSTVGKDVDIKVIDKSKWNFDKDKEIHRIPSLLREKPEINEDLEKDIYMSIDHPLSSTSLESGEIWLDDEEIGSLNNNKNRITVESTNNEKFNDNYRHNQFQTFEQVQENKKGAPVTVTHTHQTSPTTLSKNYRIAKINKQSTSKPLEDNTLVQAHSTHNKLNMYDMMKETHEKKSNRERRDSDTKLLSETQHYNPLKMFSDAIDICKNKSNKFVDISHRKLSSETTLTSARDTVEGDLELSDETCDYTEVDDEMSHDKEKNVQSERNTSSMFSSVNRELRSTKHEKKDSKEIRVFKHEIEKTESKHFDTQIKCREGHTKESKEKNNQCKDDKPKDIKSKLCDLFGESSSLITPEDLGIPPSDAKENLNVYTPLYDNTQDAVDLNIEDMEKVKTRSIKKPVERLAKEAKQDVISDKKEKVKKSKRDEKQKSKSSSAKTSPIHQMFQNINTELAKEDDRTVKTVIISTGMQNICHSTGAHHERQEKQLPNIERKINENAPNIALVNLTALATSTPHKETPVEPSLSVPKSSSHTSKGVTKDARDTASGDRKRNADEPDLRIIVKRRRKHKGKTS